MRFRDRTDAAEQLAGKLESYSKASPLILGIPRGSVPMAKILAQRLQGDFDVVLVHKIGAPDDPEFAIGSVSEFGSLYRSEAIEHYEIPNGYVERQAHEEISKLRKRRVSYSPIRPPMDPAGRVVIIVDDGIATGSTMLAAARAVRMRRPKRLIVAAPIISPRAADLIRPEVDQIVAVDVPANFYAISHFYESFPEVSDEEVAESLRSPLPGEHRAA